MMTQNNMLEWDQLSMKQRAAFIRNAVARGIYNVEDIVQDYNEFRKGGPMETPIYEDLPKMLRKAGLDIKVTSGYRPAGAAGKAGSKSWHPRHGAVDIVPQGNTTFEDIENVLHNNPAIRQYMLSHNFGLIDESGRTPESKLTMKKTGATGAHFHIGKDSKYAALYKQRVGAAQPEGDSGKTVYFTNSFLPLEQPTQQVQVQRIVTPEEILQNVTIPEPIKPDDDIQATVEIPEVEVIGHQPQVNPLTILSQIQESAPTPLVLEPYQIPQIQNKVNEIATQRTSFLQKDLEDRLLAEERRRRLGYSYRDGSIQDDIEQMQFLRNMSANGGNLYGLGGNTVKELVDALYLNNPREEYLGEPSHHYDFTQSEEWANAHGYYPDARGHRDDRVKKPAHPSHPSRGIWDGDKFILTDVGMQNPNYILFGLNDGGQDPQATLIYGNGVVLPEFTVTPKGNYIENPYDNIRIHYKALGGPTDDNDPATKDWEHRREHQEVYPMYQRTQKDEEYWREKQARNAQAAEELNRKKGVVMSALEEQANSTPFTGEGYKQAVDDQRQRALDKAKDFEKGARAVVTAAELGLSGASLLGAYANWKNWANAASLTKRGIANLLQKAQAPMQEAGALIDGYQTMDALGNNEFDAYYNGASGVLGVAGTIGASDIFRGRYPMIDRLLDTSGIIQNTGDFIKFGYDTANGKDNGGSLNIILDTNSYGGGGLMPGINIPAVAKNLYNKAKDRLYRTIIPQGYHLGRAAKEFIKGDTRDFSKFTPAENEVWARYLGVPYEGESNFEKAIYTPTKGGATYDDVIKFKDESQILSDEALRQLLNNQMLTGKNTMLVEGNESGLGTYTLSLGEDENGKYISYYDDWDINPTRGLSAKYKIPIIEQIGDVVPGSNPFTVYGRRYYTDEDLRRVIER